MAQFTILNLTSRIHRCPQNRMSDAWPQHRELYALLFTHSVWVSLMYRSYLRVVRRDLRLIVLFQEVPGRKWTYDSCDTRVEKLLAQSTKKPSSQVNTTKLTCDFQLVKCDPFATFLNNYFHCLFFCFEPIFNIEMREWNNIFLL